MQASEGTASVRPATGRPPGARAARRVLLAVTTTALAAGVMASPATASITSPATRPAAGAGEPAPNPSFFAGAVNKETSPGTFREVVQIFRSASAAITATLTFPVGQQVFGLVRLGDDQHFVAGTFDRSACVTHLWTFGIDAAGAPSALTPLPALPQFAGAIEEMTTSADGTALAFNVFGCQPGQVFQTWFLRLPTAQITRWDNPDGAGSLSLTADGSVLGLSLDENIDDPDPPEAWTMPTDTPAGPMLKRAHKVPGLGANVDRVILSPSGDQMWIEAQTEPDAPVTLSLATTSTGTLIRKIADLRPG